MQAVSLYTHAQRIAVCVNQAPVGLCVSRVPTHETTRPRIVLLHGNPASMHDFGPLAAWLRDDFDVLAIDLPGFGRSENVQPVPHESLLDTHARHIVAAIDRVGWTEDFYLLGHSHGAAVAQAIATLFPQRVSHLILLGSVGTPAHWGYRQLVVPGVMASLRVIAKNHKRALPRPVRWRIVQAVMQPIFSPAPLAHSWIDEQLAVVDSRPEILVNMALVATGDPCGQLARAASRIRAPTLFIHGDSDRLVPAVYARGVYERVLSSAPAEFHEMPRTGHMLHMSHAGEIRELMLAWLGRLRRDQAAPAADSAASSSGRAPGANSRGVPN